MLGSFLAIIALILVSAFFSATEIAYASSSEVRLRLAAEDGNKRQTLTLWIYNHYEDALTTILLGNNLANIAISSIATMIVITLLGNGYAWVATALTTILVLIFGEIVPKVVAKQMPEQFATAVCTPLRALMWLLRPVVLVVRAIVRWISRLWTGKGTAGPAVTEDDLEIMLDTAEDEGAIDELTSDLLQSALDFDDMLAYEIITPRVDMTAIDMEDTWDEIVETAIGSPYSRIPVYEGSKDSIIGVLHLSRFLKRLVDGNMGHEDLRAMLMPVCFVPKTAILPSVLTTMRQQKCHLVVVSDEFGGTLGILTMEDILEELVGDIWDETDEVDEAFTLLPDGRYAASGDMRLHDFFDALDIDDRTFDHESTTVGGWAMEMLDGYPKAGDAFDFETLHVTVERVIKRRVMRVLVGIVEPSVASE